MRLGEHVLDLHAGVDVPLRHVVLTHGFEMLLGEQLGGVALTDDLHDLERHTLVEPLVHEVGHDRVTGSDYVRNGAGAVVDELLRVAQPYVRAVRQTGDLQQVGEGLGLGFDQHALNEAGAAFGDGEGANLGVDVLRLDAERLGGGKERHDLFVAHGDVHDRNAGEQLQIVIDRRHIMAELVELGDGVMDGMEVEVGGDVVGRHIVRRVLNRTEIVDVVRPRHNNHSARVLTCGSLNTGAALGKPFKLCLVEVD